MSSLTNQLYRFGDFTLDLDQRVLSRAARPVALTPKVFDTLLILVENRGRIVEKDELMRRLWPDTFVEEANITFNIQQLRKSLSDNARDPRFIETVARRGYRFIADVEVTVTDAGPARLEPVVISTTHNGSGSNGRVPVAEPIPQVPITKMVITIAASALLVVAAIALFAWQLSTGSRGSFVDASRAGMAAVIPVKVEKLTVAGQSRHVAISPDAKYVAYTRQSEKDSSVWLRQLSTNTNVEVVPAQGIIYGLAFSNSGEYLYFVRGEPTVLYRVPLLGGSPTRIVEGLEGNFSISPDDTRVAFVRQVIDHNGLQQYSLMNAGVDGSGERRVLVQTYPNRMDVPLWSPNGNALICTSGFSEGGAQDVSLIEVSLSDGTRKELSPEKFFRIAKMAWSPDKSAIIMTARKSLGDNNQIWRVTYPEMETSCLTNELNPFLDIGVAASTGRAVASQATRVSDIWVGSSRDPKNLKKVTQAIDELSWTRDGQLVYTSTASGNRDLWIMRPDGSDQRQLTANTAVNGGPSVSPDNRYIVFTSNRTGALQLWRMNLDGSNQVQLTTGGPKTCAGISRDGKWVLFNTVDDWHLWRVAIDGGEPQQLASFVATGPSVSPDGKLIACIGRRESTREMVILPIEGGEPLKRIAIPGEVVYRSRIEWTPDGKSVIYSGKVGLRTILYRQSLEGGPSEETVEFEPDEIFDFRYSHDGQFLALTRGGWLHDVVFLSDVTK
jgi:Tol biopolymer transport system component/DNA-binding winged helix-turn-helix (wHTH) protein